jgi:hypothetical protein
MSIDWLQLQGRLYELCVDSLRHFADEHADESFYGFAFDCNADYGDVLLCLNTEEEFRKSSREFPDEPQEWLDTELRWGPGDWKYQGFNTDFDDSSQRFADGWKSYRAQISDDTVAQFHSRDALSTATLFVESVCLVLIRMEHDNIFSCLQRSGNFEVFVCDHDESFEASRQRLATIRQSPPTPDRYEHARKFAEQCRLSSEVYDIIQKQRRQAVPYSDEKFLLRDSAVTPPTAVSDGWWLVYENKEKAFQVTYNRPEDKYQLTMEGSQPILLPGIREVAQRLGQQTAK